MEALLVSAFDATPSKVEAAGPPLRACLRAASLAASRCTAPGHTFVATHLHHALSADRCRSLRVVQAC